MIQSLRGFAARSLIAPTLSLVVAALVPAGVGAQTLRRPTIAVPAHPLVAVTPEPAVPNGPKHQIFGTISKVTKTEFVLRTRTGRLIDIDAAPAVAAGLYSAPLFVGKVVVVSGPIDAHGVLYAKTVIRMTRIDDSTMHDR
jgi:hypothetical protein